MKIYVHNICIHYTYVINYIELVCCMMNTNYRNTHDTHHSHHDINIILCHNIVYGHVRHTQIYITKFV